MILALISLFDFFFSPFKIRTQEDDEDEDENSWRQKKKVPEPKPKEEKEYVVSHQLASLSFM